MSAKPTVLPRWAVTLADVLAANVTTPSSGQSDTGWTPNQLADSSFDNWAKAWSYRWLKWLDDGDVTFDDLEAATLHITGASDFDGDVNVDGGITVDGVIRFGTAIEHTIPVHMSVDPVGVSTLGDFKRTFAGYSAGTCAIYPVPINEFETLTEWSIYINDTASGTAMTARLFSANALTQAETPLGNLKTSGQLGYQQLTDPSLTINKANSDQLYVKVNSAGVGTELYHVTYKTKRI